MSKRGFAGFVFIGLALAGCSGVAATATPTTIAPIAASNWPPAGMREGPTDEVAWQWTDLNDFDCKSYQDGPCWGITVAAQYGCPGGIYVEIAVKNDQGVAIDKANEITAGIPAGGKAQTILAAPGGAPNDARAIPMKLNCLS